MDEIREYEIYMLLNMRPWASKQSMEETRMLLYAIAPPKQKKPLDQFLRLVTDEDDEAPELLEGEKLSNARDAIKQAFGIKNN